MLDSALLVTVLCLFLGQKIWARAFSDAIPDSFWYVIPQASTDSGASVEPDERTRNTQKEKISRKLQMIIFWGSQSGRAEMLARRLAKRLHDRFNLHVLVADLSDYDHQNLVELQSTTPCGFIVSTYGDGDPPYNANSFMTTLQALEREGVTLKNLRYFIFGLGNSKYRMFNRVADQVDETLLKLGAIRYGSPGRGDDADGSMESSYLAWRPMPRKVHTGEPYQPLSGLSNRQNDSAIRPFDISKIYKMWEDAERVCLHVEIDLGSDRSVKYKTGDHIAIWPSNSNSQVDRLLSALHLNGDPQRSIFIRPVDGASTGKTTIPSHTTLDALLRYYLEIAGPVSPETIADLSHFISDESARQELQRLTADLAVFQSEITASFLTLVDVLHKVNPRGGWNLPLSFLLERLNTMQPQLYSIASSPTVHPEGISICLVTDGDHGIPTNYIHAHWAEKNPGMAYKPTHALDGPGQLLAGGKIFSQIQRSAFKLPFRASTPIIMVGAGTEVAPFRGFLEDRARHRELGQEIGKSLLFMGFRHPDVDVSYENDWKNWQRVLGTDLFQF
ncbi:riboflavin synthase domain-like protein [Aspergillus ellipticus CBS 707.79]|uniref:Riboflavin synthase domain-like protein n=1 Tax=Aspergillus ellipticus CBS 707.79 TaxID=1448320 RepID=A0A319DGZ5_9EURO|nr:riboflavin synthase domain-like protein [Aspergillus ellipticus CBS 707.79]